MLKTHLNVVVVVVVVVMVVVVVVVVVVSQFNGTSTPKGSYSAKTGDNDCNVNSSRHCLSTALCESNALSGQV